MKSLCAKLSWFCLLAVLGLFGCDVLLNTDGDPSVASEDCNDSDGSVYPGALEVCDGIDNDCDGLVDDEDVGNVSSDLTYYFDGDGDQYGDFDDAIQVCTVAPEGYVIDGGDCDDSNALINPAASELCDGVDNNCNEMIDEDIDFVAWYIDADGDGYGVYSSDPRVECISIETGYSSVTGDCDDSDPEINPGMDEVCDEIDNDCDGVVDVDAVDTSIWYVDADGDSYGDQAVSVTACFQPVGYVADSTDCDDADAAVNPELVWYYDSDGDGYGSSESNTWVSCVAPEGYVGNIDDCDDENNEINPEAIEVCDTIDNNCNGLIDDEEFGVSGQPTWYADTDGDSYGDQAVSVTACFQPVGYVADSTDCDDQDKSVYPGAGEYCDTIDNNCDGEIDEDTTFVVPFYQDFDKDGYGNGEIVAWSCGRAVDGYVGQSGDCDDQDRLVHPGAMELCDGVDNDCDGVVDEPDEAQRWYKDADGDGFGGHSASVQSCIQPEGYTLFSTDCDDQDASVYPDAVEYCDGVDHDCDGTTDVGAIDAAIWYRDGDQDGYGNAEVSVEACQKPDGYVADNTDCNDTRSDIYPGAPEKCDGMDHDCDGQSYESDSTDVSTFYGDIDGDGYGSLPVRSCSQPEGTVLNNLDCDDQDASVYPGAVEYCDGVDHDCDGQVNESNSSDASVFYADADMDGYGAGAPVSACNQPEGTVQNSLDCDDSDPSVYPGAVEYCDGVDHDCDGTTDVGAIDAAIWYRDGDQDGYGNAEVSVEACQKPDGYVTDNTDCNDTRSDIHPGAQEFCGGVDYDCDGLANESTEAPTWYTDSDQDGYGTVTGVQACLIPSDETYSTMSGDCDDGNALVYPTASETCNQVDDDCDGNVDEGAIDAPTYYLDRDNDGYGVSTSSTKSCVAPDGYVSTFGDCNDSSASINPGAMETCDGVDNNCDGSVDPSDSVDAATWYADTDSDGYGNGSSTKKACIQPAGYVSLAGDCNDSSASINPGAMETCDGVDNNCDGTIDSDASDRKTWYTDADGDGYGVSSQTTLSCSKPSGYSSQPGDCNDTVSTINPSATEICDGADDDCDGAVDEDAADAEIWYTDSDHDGYGDVQSPIRSCVQPSGTVTNSSDCDDSDAAVNPAASEVCDSFDNNCDGVIDTDAVDRQTFYADTDGDGYGDPSKTAMACEAPSGYISDNTDCNDTSPSVYPGASETCNQVDDDCDGQMDEGVKLIYYADVDQDGYGNPLISIEACSTPSGYVSDNTDCKDTNDSIYPGAVEVCNGLDDDCDEEVDEGVLVTYYPDSDGDGYGREGGLTKQACSTPIGYSQFSTDCNDLDAAVNPGALETCNEIDDNCNLVVDEGVQTSYYADLDGDTYGNPASLTLACSAPTGYVITYTDCNDQNAAVNPAATEVCDGVDNDCDLVVDDGLKKPFYYDADLDGYGVVSSTTVACSAPTGYAALSGDCNNNNAAINPGATELCDTFDNDCDGTVDEPDAADAKTIFQDSDGDGYGGNTSSKSCGVPSGWTVTIGDCDDANDAINPGATELCDTFDNDCDGTVDEPDAADAVNWYLDEDGDDYGDELADPVVACSQPNGSYSSDSTDCDDLYENTYPDAPELCDGLDNDCDDEVDENLDCDGDGYASTNQQGVEIDCDDNDAAVNPGQLEICGSAVDNDCDGTADSSEEVCTDAIDDDLDGYSENDGDCDDSDPEVYPGAEEVNDTFDNDCDGQVDEGLPGTDDDGDGLSENDGDCDDSDSEVYPDAVEVCDTVDNDCDRLVDEPSIEGPVCQSFDYDGDGYAPTDGSGETVDCDDEDAAVNPGEVEICSDGVDNDCDDLTTDDTADGFCEPPPEQPAP